MSCWGLGEKREQKSDFWAVSDLLSSKIPQQQMHCSLRILIVYCEMREDKVMFDKHFMVLVIAGEEMNYLKVTLTFSGYVHLRQLM